MLFLYNISQLEILIYYDLYCHITASQLWNSAALGQMYFYPTHTWSSEYFVSNKYFLLKLNFIQAEQQKERFNISKIV